MTAPEPAFPRSSESAKVTGDQTSSARPAPLAWRRLALLLSLVIAAGYLVVAVLRVVYPYDLDFIEDGMLMQAWRMAQGLPTYLLPNAVFVPHAYPPLYSWLGSLLLRGTGLAFWPLRTLSLAATCVSAGLIFAIAQREGREIALSAAGAALFLAGNRVVNGWYELARVDALFLMLLLAGMALAVYRHDSPLGLLASALALVASCFTKQAGLFFLLVVGVYLLWRRRAAAWP